MKPIKAIDIHLKCYNPIYSTFEIEKQSDLSKSFVSTILFYQDLFEVTEKVNACQGDRMQVLKDEVRKINERLPAVCYLPFRKESIRNHVILNIVVSECRVFQTKERCPFYLCAELFRPEEISRQRDFDQLVISKQGLSPKKRL